ADRGGLSGCLAVRAGFLTHCGYPIYRACPWLRDLAGGGRLGRKTGRGVYDYSK
ncbi:3-hydroxybutyryl-CoA dehydrogenase, partial [Burkholderia multivorans]|uniref:3-hydroxyacyl-CoA dehydrogenase family protein n=1 Tax=Burkholderia multivorans TaxID=87883 RepID=UPI000D48DB5B